MASPKPPAPDEVPETAAAYERSTADTTLKREDAASPKSVDAGVPPSEQQKALPVAAQKQIRRQQQQQTSGERSDSTRSGPLPAGGKITGDMKTEEPEGWDQAPTDIKDPRQQRHPRPDGVGGSEPGSAKRDPKR